MGLEALAGSGYDYISSTEPSSPNIGESWLDTSSGRPTEKVYVDLGGGGSWSKSRLQEIVETNLDARVSDGIPINVPNNVQSIKPAKQSSSGSSWTLPEGETTNAFDVTILGEFDHRGTFNVFGVSTALIDGGTWTLDDTTGSILSFEREGSNIEVTNGGLGTFGGTTTLLANSSIDIVQGGQLDAVGTINSGSGSSLTIDSQSQCNVNSSGLIGYGENSSIDIRGTLNIDGEFQITSGSSVSQKSKISGGGKITGSGVLSLV